MTETDSGMMHIDRAIALPGAAFLLGWQTIASDLEVFDESGNRIPASVFRTRRDDVAAAKAIKDGTGLGFCILAEHSGSRKLTVRRANVSEVGVTAELKPSARLLPNTMRIEKAELLEIAAQLEPGSAPWLAVVSAIPPRHGGAESGTGHLDCVLVDPQSGVGMALGWTFRDQRMPQVWLDLDDSGIVSMNHAYRRARADVWEVVGKQRPSVEMKPGFVQGLRGLKPGTRVRLMGYDKTDVHQLAQATCEALPYDLFGTATALFGAESNTSDFPRFVREVSLECMGEVISSRQANWPASEPVVSFGEGSKQAQVSIVVPLYRRYDFMKHQLLEFERDPWILENAEIIYVLDDPPLTDELLREANVLWELHRVPFKLVCGSVNRGFSGANNLGAQVARASKLLFMNSDVIPQKAGWLPAMVEVLDAEDSVGAVGPRLLFATGGLQHAGMEFLFRRDLDLFVNHHPLMGLDPMLDHAGARDVPALTGACLLVRREDFLKAGGWSTDYLIGDFEDSDLCLKLREDGKRLRYLPEACLTHLERQSFAEVGAGASRFKITLFNAVLHDDRWRPVLEEIARDQRSA